MSQEIEFKLPTRERQREAARLRRLAFFLPHAPDPLLDSIRTDSRELADLVDDTSNEDRAKYIEMFRTSLDRLGEKIMANPGSLGIILPTGYFRGPRGEALLDRFDRTKDGADFEQHKVIEIPRATITTVLMQPLESRDSNHPTMNLQLLNETAGRLDSSNPGYWYGVPLLSAEVVILPPDPEATDAA